MPVISQENCVIDDSLSGYRSREKEINEVMYGAVLGHNNENDHFTPLEYSPRHRFQRADCVGLIGEAATLGTFQGLAPAIFPDFDRSVDRLIDTRPDLLSHAADVLTSGHDLHVVTDHRDVIGVAVGSAIVTAALYESGDVKHGDIDTQIAVSTMLKNTAILGEPAADILRSVFSTTCFVVPSSNRTNRQRIPSDYVERFNAAGRNARHDSRGKPSLVAVAPSGTRDVRVKHKMHHRDKNGYYMGPPSDGTVAEYMTNKHLLTMGVDIGKGDEGVFIGKLWLPSELKPVTKLAIMTTIADGISRQTGVPSHYVADWNEFQNLKITEKDHQL